MRCNDAANPKGIDDGLGDDVIVDGKRRRRKARREVLMKDLSVIIQEGSPFIVYSDVQERTAVTLRMAPRSELGRARENAEPET
jgi:hypothetical protein